MSAATAVAVNTVAGNPVRYPAHCYNYISATLTNRVQLTLKPRFLQSQEMLITKIFALVMKAKRIRISDSSS